MLGGDLHGPIEVRSYYSPWNVDDEFLFIWEKVRTRTMVDFMRLYELWTLTEQVSKLDSGVVIEVGVRKGGSGCLMAHRAESLGIPGPFYLCDNFEGLVKLGEKDTFHREGKFAVVPAHVFDLIEEMSLEDYVKVLAGTFPDETAHIIYEPNVRLCHIDVDIYQSAKDVAEWVWPRLVLGGVVVYDDYGFKECSGVTELVNEQMDKPDRIVLYNLNGHAIVIKIGT